MNNIIKTTKYELSKIFARKKYIAILLLEILFFILAGLLIYNFNLEAFTTSLPTLFFTALSAFLSLVLPITVFMMASDLITLEFENLTIKNIFLRPVSRLDIYISKNLAMCIYMLINLLVIYFSVLFIKLVFSGSAEFFITSFFSYIISIVPISVFIIASCFVATCVSSSSMTMFLLLIIYILLTAASVYSSPLFSILFINYTSYYKLFIGNMMPLKHILTVTFLLLSTSLIFFIMGFLKFDKREV